MTRTLEGKCALVTGAGQGVGQGIARALAAAGADVFVAQRRLEEAEREAAFIRDEYAVRTFARATDVTDKAAIEAMIGDAVARMGRLDILVNNAGGSFAKRLEAHSDDDMAGAFALNYWSVFWAMRAAYPVMKAQSYGRIINVGSLNGVNAHMFTAAYNASKEAMRALSRTAAVEWGPHGVIVNIICPAASSPQAQAYFEANPDMLKPILDQIPVGRMGRPQADIGPVAVFLASEACAFMNGNTLFVDGGSHINGVSWRPDVGD
jgi:NAD(P)-dependent dehydrogenase (short-subunit alcohol dehydrogenase family)